MSRRACVRRWPRAVSRDAESGGAAHGPHRSDLTVIDLDTDMPAARCSTGEQKALLIAIVIANTRLHTARRSETPLLLLDEVVAHLDPDRRAALLEAVLELGAQAWLTGPSRRCSSRLPRVPNFSPFATPRPMPWRKDSRT